MRARSSESDFGPRERVRVRERERFNSLPTDRHARGTSEFLIILVVIILLVLVSMPIAQGNACLTGIVDLSLKTSGCGLYGFSVAKSLRDSATFGKCVAERRSRFGWRV